MTHKQLYKYTNINTLKAILENSTLKFSSPNEFNDPYDCNLPFDFDNTEEEVLAFFHYVREKEPNLELNKIFTNLPHNWRQMSEDHIIREHAKKNAHNEISLGKEANSAIEIIRNNIGICCFSKDSSNILMWAHYADEHRGVCLEFDTFCDKSIFSYIIEVDYQINIDKLNFLRSMFDGNKLTKYFAETKSIDWEYEEEVRSIKKEKGFYKFNPDSLKTIIFGIRINPIEVECIKAYCKKNKQFNHVEFFLASKEDEKFRITY